MKPPYEITSEILKLTSSISEKIGEIKSAKLMLGRESNSNKTDNHKPTPTLSQCAFRTLYSQK